MVNLNIGQKIQKYRTQRGLSLRGLAEKTGITASMISQIENNAVNPSINTLKTLAETLDFPLYVLFQEDSDPEQELIVRKGEYRSIGNRNSEVAYNLLTADTKASIEFVLMEIPPQTVTSDKDRSHVGEETAYVEEGDVTISLNGELFELHTGDAVRIPAGTGHRWFNTGDKTETVIIAPNDPLVVSEIQAYVSRQLNTRVIPVQGCQAIYWSEVNTIPVFTLADIQRYEEEYQKYRENSMPGIHLCETMEENWENFPLLGSESDLLKLLSFFRNYN